MKSVRGLLMSGALVMLGTTFAVAENPMVGGAAMFETKDIIDNAVNSADHTTLVAAVKAAGLVETLKTPGPFTVLAPTNDAFAALPAGTVESLLKPENKAMLVKILTCHVIAAKALSTDITSMAMADGGIHIVDTVGGCKLQLKSEGGKVTITDETGGVATVTIADVIQSNGVIHVIDKVLLPKAEDSAMAAPMADDAMAGDFPMVGGAAMYPTKNIIENAVNSADHTTLVAAVKAAGFVDALSGAGPFTVFAPTHEAFAKLPTGTVDTLLKPENKDQLVKILTAHVVSGKFSAADLITKAKANGGRYNLETLSGDGLTAVLRGKQLYIFDEAGGAALVTVADVNQSNGVIHVVDDVLLPK